MFQNLSAYEILVVLVSMVASLTVHEAMHAYAGHKLGDSTAKEMGRLTLNPLKHIDIITTVMLPLLLIVAGLTPFFVAKPVPFNPDRVRYDEWGAAMIAVVGPLSNLVLAVLAGAILRLGIFNFSGSLATAIILFAQINIGYFVFNMIPFPPLDGSRVLYAVAPEPIQAIMERIEGMGILGIFLFIFVLFPFLAPVVGSITLTLSRLLIY